MEKEFADLHVHTIYSDGTFPPEAIIAEAAKCGLKIISLTDHDTADVYLAEGIQSVSSRYGVEIIPGVEFSADYYMQSRHLIEVHVIGYFIDIFDQKLKDYFREYQEMRYLRAQAILKKLNAMNIPLQMQDLKKEVKKNIFGRLHIAQLIVEKGFAGSLKEAFKKYIGHLAPAYVAKKQKKLPELVKIIRDCGGIPVIAHPGLQGLDKELQALKDSGIEGVEVFHPDHAPALSQKLLEESERLSLLITGGSDYHGSAKENLPLGIIRLPCRYAVKLKEAHRARVH